jgi:hypothetical protein
LAFLILYTYVGLSMERDFTWAEVLSNSWILAFVVRECRDFLVMGKRYFVPWNNRFDCSMLLFYLPAIVLRLRERFGLTEAEFLALGGAPPLGGGPASPLEDGALAVYGTPGEDFVRARSWHGMAGILFWVRLVDYFRVSRTLGPLWLAIVRVSWDAALFFFILLVFVVAFGAAMLCAGRPRANPGDTFHRLLEQGRRAGARAPS